MNYEGTTTQIRVRIFQRGIILNYGRNTITVQNKAVTHGI
jgi:hypothetical protein